ncbi:hypothetical protein [Streptomyces erythrochromogenes]|uniref:hypothetical protein n=1 Tax=Streptomyces erythrochromogenes TaxID=285574 RepID=UPI002256EB68|nr:hypothetical protein [Streptomyces erythrochromogenes]MCX5582091.1 hypothetical protein [Streptomyces erythrochromogenes]
MFEAQGRKDVLSDPSFAEYFAWEPHRSNCPDLESLLEGLICALPEEWKARARRLFAGRNLHGHANAEAWRSGEVGVIEINYGITSAAMIYSVLYYKYFEMVRTLGAEVDFVDDDEEVLMMILEEVGDSGFTPILIADGEKGSWRANRRIFAGHELLRELPASASYDAYHELVRSIEEFVLAHELAHHLLGHTSDPYPRASQNLTHFKKIKDKYGILPPDETLNPEQKDEMEADTLALLVMSGALTGEITSGRIYRAAGGSVIALTALAHIDDSWVASNEPGQTHPDFITRYANAVDLVKKISKETPVGVEGGHPVGFLAQLSGFVSLILDRWLSKNMPQHTPVNVLSLSYWLFEAAVALEAELKELGIQDSRLADP